MGEDIALAFDHGDLMLTALEGSPDQWQYHAAIGVIRDSRDGIDGLARFDHDDARFHTAVLYWLDGDEDSAARILERLPTEHAQNLLGMVRAPQIRVLSYMPPVRHGFFILSEGILADRKFSVSNVGPMPGDLPFMPNASVWNYVDRNAPPDFFVTYPIEWQHFPSDLAALPCPTIGFTNDFDAHIHGIHRWLSPFDCRAVIDHVVELPKVRALGGAPTITFPTVFGLPFDMKALRHERPRDIDVLFSGTLVSGYHPEKEKFVFELLDVQDADVLLVDGHLSVGTYFDLLARSKITPSYCRHPGGIQTRVIEALCMGSIAMVQPESIMHLWADESVGLFTFETDEGPAPTIRRILADYDRHHANCVANIDRLRASFEPRRVASRFFRYCTVMAARPRAGRRPVDRYINQKRVIFVHGPTLDHGTATTVAHSNAARMEEEFVVRPEAWLPIEQGREDLLVYAQAVYDERLEDADPGLLRSAIQRFDEAARSFPGNLVARFNAFRARLHFGEIRDVAAAVGAAKEIAAADVDAWEVDPRDDVMPYDFFDQWFNYREYLDLVVDLLAEDDPRGRERLRDLILAAIHHYLAVILGDRGHASTSCSLDPAFKRYQLTRGELLAAEGTVASASDAADILLPLATRSVLAQRARCLLHSLKVQHGDAITADLAEADAVIEKLRASLLQIEHYAQKVKSPYFQRNAVRKGGAYGIMRHRVADGTDETPLLSVIVCGTAGLWGDETIAALAAQSVPRSAFEIIYVDCYATVPANAQAFADSIVTLDQRELLENQAIGISQGLALARGELVMILQSGEILPPGTLADVFGIFYENSLDAAAGKAAGTVSGPRDVVLCGRPGKDPWAPGFTVVGLLRSMRVGGIETSETFQGSLSCVANLVDRLARAGTPVLERHGARWVPAPTSPWWSPGGRAGSAMLSQIGAEIWPTLYEAENQLGHSNPGPRFVEEGADCNIIEFQGVFYVIPKALGAVDWDELGRTGHPDVYSSYSLKHARRVLMDPDLFREQPLYPANSDRARRVLSGRRSGKTVEAEALA